MFKLNRFYVFLLLILFLILGIFTNTNLTTGKASAFSFFGKVLGDDDEDHSGSGKGGNDDDDDDKDEDDEDDEDDGDEDDNDNEDEDDNDDDSKKESNSGRGNRNETRTTTVNKDGTRTVTKKKVEDDGKVEVESKTYNVEGRVIEEYKSKKESEGSETELEYKAKEFSADGGKVSEIKFKSKDGEDIKLMIKNDDKSITKVRYDENHNYIRVIGRPSDESDDDGIDDEIEDEIESEDDILLKTEDGETFEIERHGKKAHVKIPLTVDDSTGEVLLLTATGEKTLKNLPDQIIQKIEESDDSIEISDVEIKEDDGKIIYEISAEKAQNILGLFEQRIETLITYDAETGEEIESPQSFWDSIMEALNI